MEREKKDYIYFAQMELSEILNLDSICSEHLECIAKLGKYDEYTKRVYCDKSSELDEFMSAMSWEVYRTIRNRLSAFFRNDFVGLAKEIDFKYDDSRQAGVLKRHIAGLSTFLKNVFDIPISYDLQELSFEEFFDRDRLDIHPQVDDIGLTLVTPKQMVHAVAKDPRVNGHSILLLELLRKIYSYKLDVRKDCLPEPLDDLVEREEQRFVRIRYVVSGTPQVDAYVFIPAYITPFEKEALSEMIGVFNNYRINQIVYVINFDSIKGIGNYQKSLLLETDSIEKAVDFLERTGRVTDYNFGEEEKIIWKEMSRIKE